jgi:hypothetical protein
MSYQLLITTTVTMYHQIEVGYGSYRRGGIAGVSSSTTTASFDTLRKADDAADLLAKDSSVTVRKLYKPVEENK